MKQDLIRLRLTQAVVTAGVMTTFLVNPWGNFDPISVVKMLALSSSAFLILALLFVGRNYLQLATEKYLLLAASFFIGWMMLAVLFSGAPLNQQVWGSFGRNTGFLTYASLTLVMLGAVYIRALGGYKKLIDLFLISSVPMTAYCLVQLSGNDPIGWSYSAAFGTLGNINFLSAYMGLVTVTALSYAIAFFNKKALISICLVFIILVDLYIVLMTGSIQGIVIFGAGAFVVIFLWLRSNKYSRILQPSFVFISTITAIPTVMGILNSGPLAKYLFQNSTKLRGDYILAGWEMTLNHPFFGVGMDSYGDWYRETRTQSAAENGVDRVANTAHNIFLDISSNGGFPLLVAYFSLLVIAGLSAIKSYKLIGSRFDPVFAAILAAWLAYQIQALVSINQIGVGIWGWIFTGSLIGYSKGLAKNADGVIQNSNAKRMKGQLLPPGAGLIAIFGAVFGFSLGAVPVKADMDYIKSVRTGSLEQIVSNTRLLGSTPWHSEMALNYALNIPAPPQSLEIARYLVSKYPRNSFGWQAIYFSDLATLEERQIAIRILRKLDPYNPNWRQ